MKLIVTGLILLATSLAACGGGEGDKDGEALLAHVPLVEGAVETDRTVTSVGVVVTYETEATLEEATQHYRTVMSEPPWRVTTFEVNYRLGSAYLVFRSDDEGLLAATRIRRQEDDVLEIELDMGPIPWATSPSAEAPS